MRRLNPVLLLSFMIGTAAGTIARSQENDSRLDQELEAGLNRQVNEEMSSSYLYLSMAAYKHEKHISACIRTLVMQARELDDDSTGNFLQWFVAEQVEEEDSTYKIVQQLKLIGGDRAALFLIDRELAKRAPPPNPAPVAP